MTSSVTGLPEHLTERVRTVGGGAPREHGEFVLYWMHHAVRGHENPALDVAVSLANERDLPVLVYQGLGGAHPYNSDRHHTFILEGARDAQRELRLRGIARVFYLGHRPDQATPLTSLARRSAVVVTEEHPVPPFPEWAQRLSDRVDAPVLAVDARCIVPMTWPGRSFDRAYKFREKTREEFERRVPWIWRDVEPEVGSGAVPDPGFESIELEAADIPDLCSLCEIDHSVGPVPHTVGGSRAGYTRWEAFRKHGLSGYKRLRNDAAVAWPRGVSRLSPYLHHGHVSPFRIAREALQEGTGGADKFLDELCIWRELAHNFCFHADDPEQLDALPDWARETLEAHAGDERPATYSRERLARGKTESELWNAAQKSLLIHGELHNNVRMTWGKALLQWTESPKEALDTLIDLNHRYALDGSDPNSYGGLLWCLGLFDRPFTPARPVIGTVRPRSVARHAQRLDIQTYVRRVTGPARRDELRVAIVGAGISGLAAARTLGDHGLSVQVFDKGRGPGGRASTRRHDDRRFDHGAQYFTVRDERFRRYVDSWLEDGVAARWEGAIGVARNGSVTIKPDGPDRFVGTPGMNALARHLAEDVDVVFNTRVGKVDHSGKEWTLFDAQGSQLSSADVLLVTTPPSQSAELLSTVVPELAESCAEISMQPCRAVMVTFGRRIAVPFDGLFVHNSPIGWACRNNSKPDRPRGESWVLHATPEWSSDHLESSSEGVARALVDAFFTAVGVRPVAPEFVREHRWRFALADEPLQAGCLWDASLQAGACGDWCHGSRIEGAFLSGMAAAGRVLGLPDPNAAPGLQAPGLEAPGSQADLFAPEPPQNP